MLDYRVSAGQDTKYTVRDLNNGDGVHIDGLRRLVLAPLPKILDFAQINNDIGMFSVSSSFFLSFSLFLSFVALFDYVNISQALQTLDDVNGCSS